MQDMVIADLEARKAIGLERYGTLLYPNNGRDMLQDVYEELLDAAVYMRGLMAERETSQSPVEAVESAGKTKYGYCVTHAYPAIVYGDDSVQCMHDLILETSSETHQVSSFLPEMLR